MRRVEPFNTSVFAQYTVEVRQREIVETRMKQLGVPTAVHYPLRAAHAAGLRAPRAEGEGTFPFRKPRRGA